MTLAFIWRLFQVVIFRFLDIFTYLLLDLYPLLSSHLLLYRCYLPLSSKLRFPLDTTSHKGKTRNDLLFLKYE